MRVLAAFGLVILLMALLLVGIYVRRLLLERGGGTIELSLRLKDQTNGRGWVLGVGRFEGEELRWYRVFSLAVGPRRRLSRRDLRVENRRAPLGGESLALLSGAVVMECSSVSGGDVMLAMDSGAVTGFLAWLESTPPGPR